MIRPILLLEINEVPWRLLDRYRGQGYDALDRFFANSRTLTNVAVDDDFEYLWPWVTWPTFHRGVPFEGHGIKHLGQDISTYGGTPIWQEFRERGHSIGIFGSLHSWPPIDPGPDGFYVPDTFAHDESCIPSSLEPLQRFNLQQTRTNKRIVDASSLLSRETLRLAKSLKFVRPRTLVEASWQLLSERTDKRRVVRRPVFQPIVMWDAFRSLFDCDRPPALSTFYTNHVAGMMHRYWKDVFPEDFDLPIDVEAPYRSTMDFAIEVVDRMLADAMGFCERNRDLIIVFATTMGQSAIYADYYEGVQLILKDFSKLARCLGLSQGDYRELMAMDPQTAVEIGDPEVRMRTLEALESCATLEGRPLFKVHQVGESLSITLGLPPKAQIEAGYWKTDGVTRTWKEGGIQVAYTDAQTADHVKEGAMAIYGAGIAPDSNRSLLPDDRAKDYLMELAEL